MRRLLIHRPNISGLSYTVLYCILKTQYFPGVTSSVIHGPLVSYHIIIIFYYCIDLDRHIPINMYTIYIKTDGSENE